MGDAAFSCERQPHENVPLDQVVTKQSTGQFEFKFSMNFACAFAVIVAMWGTSSSGPPRSGAEASKRSLVQALSVMSCSVSAPNDVGTGDPGFRSRKSFQRERKYLAVQVLKGSPQKPPSLLQTYHFRRNPRSNAYEMWLMRSYGSASD